MTKEDEISTEQKNSDDITLTKNTTEIEKLQLGDNGMDSSVSEAGYVMSDDPSPSTSSSSTTLDTLDKQDKRPKGRNSRDRNFVGRSMFQEGFEERRDLEQYFWTEKTINSILDALKFTFGPDASCCLCTPTVAHQWWIEGEDVNLLDIDTRFEYLPKFRYFDLRLPTETQLPESEQENWRVIVFDPPFFYIPMNVLYEAVLHVCQRRIKQTKLLIGFLKREEKTLLDIFKEFNLKRTNFPLEYEHVKSNKWVNYAMYSNVDLPGIKRIQK